MRPEGSVMPAMSSRAPLGLWGNSLLAGLPLGFVYLSTIWSFSFKCLSISGSA